MNVPEIMRINYAFEESKCAIAEQIYKATKQFIAQPHHMNFYDLLTLKGLSDELISEVIEALPPIKKMVEPEMWSKLIGNPQFLCLTTLAASYPMQRPGAIYNWEQFETKVQKGQPPLAVSRFFYRSAIFGSLNLLIMELVAPIDGFDGLTDMYFFLPNNTVDLLIFFQPVQSEKFNGYVQSVCSGKGEEQAAKMEKAPEALKYHLGGWKIFILEAMARYNSKYCHYDSNKVTFAELLCDPEFDGAFWRNLIDDLSENCDEITEQEKIYISSFNNIIGIVQTIIEGGIKDVIHKTFIDLNVDLIFPGNKIRKTKAVLEGYKKTAGFKVFIINCVEPDFPLPELPFFAIDENIAYCFRFLTAAELKKKKLQITAAE